jgi:CPA1 family monovalent cation:H+ antiporter
MRGIVTLAAAIALPPGFPFRDLIVLTAFSVVLGTLLIQGLTLGRLLQMLDLKDGDPVLAESRAARERVLQAALAATEDGQSEVQTLVRKQFKVRLASRLGQASAPGKLEEYAQAHREALRAARQALLAMRESGEIGDDAFHALENDLDAMEVADPLRSANADETSRA